MVAKILQRAIKVLPTVGAEAGKLSGSCLLLSCQAGSGLGRCRGEKDPPRKQSDKSASVFALALKVDSLIFPVLKGLKAL